MANPTPDQATITQRGAQLRDDVGTNYGFNYINVKALTAGQTIKTGAGVLHSIVVNKIGSGDSIALYDNTTATGSTLIGTINAQTIATTYLYDVGFTTGLSITVTGASSGDYTFNYI